MKDKMCTGKKMLCAMPGSVIIFVLFLSLQSFAQEKAPVNFGKVTPADFNLPNSPVIDSNASAVIIADVGNTSFKGNDKGWVSYVFRRQTRIKIINKKAFDAATVRIGLPLYENAEEKIDKIEAICYNLENGKVTQAELNKDNIFTDNISKQYVEKKFTIPAVKEGSIIEYSYTIISEIDRFVPDWEFQSVEYPCLWSEYNFTTPNLVSYVFLHQGVHPFYIDKVTEGYERYTVKTQSKEGTGGLVNIENSLNVGSQTFKHRWVIKDIPPLKFDNYIFTAKNYIDQLEFQQSSTYDGESSHPVHNSWKTTTAQLLGASYFGLVIQPDNFSSTKEIDTIGEGVNKDIDKARAIYLYVQNNFTCTNHYNIYVNTNLDNVIRKKSGGVGEINLLLIAILRKKGIHADPVLLNTTEYGFNIPSYPILERLNYVVCALWIDGKINYLDASQKELGFGRLALNCYNGHARIICETDSASVYFDPNSIKETETTSVFVYNNEKENGSMAGSLELQRGYFNSYLIRKEINSQGKNEYLKKLQLLNVPDIKIENIEIDSLLSLNDPVKLHCDFNFKNTNDDHIYFEPMMGLGFHENPFKAVERKYPIEMHYPIDETYVFNEDIPTGYIVEELPKSVRAAYNENDGIFEYLIQKSETAIQLRCRIKLNKAIFTSDDYNSLRDFFALVVKKQNEQIVFKKK